MSPDWQALDWIGLPVAVLDRQGAVLFANSALEDVLSLSRRVLAGTPLARLLVDSQPLERALADVRALADTELRFAAQLISTQQGPVDVQARLRMAGPQQLVAELALPGTQARQEREERLREQGEAHRELVRNLAHEIRNPLGGIRGAAQLLQLELPEPELAEYTRLIIAEADRLRSLVDRLLEPHRACGKPGQVNIHEICEHVRTLVHAEHPRGLALQRDYDASIPELHGDRAALVQALLNMVRNACQALASRIAAGNAEIVLRTRVAHQVSLGHRQHRLALVLDVIDNGPGVPQTLRERIFLPLVTGRADGIGLGLTLAQAIAQRHGGLVECESRPGCTRFSLMLPLA